MGVGEGDGKANGDRDGVVMKLEDWNDGRKGWG